jgi:hypothetical protein
MSFPLDCEKDFLLSNCIYYGPICFYRRRGKAPTLLTGRKSKFEQINKEEIFQRNVRREKKRLLSRKLKEKREKIENELIQQIKQLEGKEFDLENLIKQRQVYKKQLIYQLEHSNQDSLLDLINNKEIPLFFQQFDHSFLDIDFSINTLTDE